MKFSKTGTEKSDNLIEVTTWAGLTLFDDILTTLLSMIAGYHIAWLKRQPNNNKTWDDPSRISCICHFCELSVIKWNIVI
jgi:hypothetical protein